MSENQQPTQETTQETPNELSLGVANLTTKVEGILNSWQVRVGLIASALLGLFLLWFFWSHMIAVWGMKGWAAAAGSDARPIECMIKDTNGDSYVSCTAILKEQVVPLECGASVWNKGCRVNYGAAAAPVVRQDKPR